MKARKFLAAHTDIQAYERETGGLPHESGITMSPLLGLDEAGPQFQQGGDDMTFSNIAGTLPTNDRARFERMLFRTTRGNCYVRFSPLSARAINAQGEPIQKICFIIFYKSSSIESKIKRICDAFSATRYDLSNLNRPDLLDRVQQDNQKEMLDAKKILDKNIETRTRLCVEVSANVEEWLWIVKREKAIYHTLNLFKDDVAGNLLRGRGWILTSKAGEARAALRRAYTSLKLVPSALIERVPEQWPTAPTHFETDKFRYAFQEFVNTYGIPRYKEINPALFTAATFPFLFGVMYGDIGHGSCLAMFGLYLILTERVLNQRSTSESARELYSARYMLFGMGLMAVYCGLIYNDYFSIGLDLFGTRYEFPSETVGTQAVYECAYGDASCVYPFGVDPVWKLSDNELLFFNSMKMKMSVILGITQMCFGILLRGINSFYFKSYLDLTCEFLPMIIFAVAFFGYMVILIFIKWSINWQNRMALGSCNYSSSGVFGGCMLSATNPTCYTSTGVVCNVDTLLSVKCPLGYGGLSGGCQPPNLITTLINIALKPGSVDEPMFPGQASLQTIILLVAFICVPWLLLVKPLYLRYTHKPPPVDLHGHGAENPLLGPDAEELGHANPHGSATAGHDSGGGHGDHGHGGEFNFGEIAIHQAIETIEFVLGMVSNTASYLRLWALSLAHTELATVFWEKAMLSMINTGNPVLIFMGYAVFAAVTFAVLLAMDVLECFLHALRLHWVEFQNKFFKADGYRFLPFDFKSILSKALLE